jgi:hypothetical protein
MWSEKQSLTPPRNCGKVTVHTRVVIEETAGGLLKKYKKSNKKK